MDVAVDANFDSDPNYPNDMVPQSRRAEHLFFLSPGGLMFLFRDRIPYSSVACRDGRHRNSFADASGARVSHFWP